MLPEASVALSLLLGRSGLYWDDTFTFFYVRQMTGVQQVTKEETTDK